MKHPICLNMIVRNEAAVIRRCLDSVRPVIDHWVIVDTGSTDGTQDVVRDALRDIPGTLYERPWVDFGHNRTEAFELARPTADYVLLIDADDELAFDSEQKLPALTCDCYTIRAHAKGTSYQKPELLCTRLPWRWVGTTHEQLQCDQSYTSDELRGVHYLLATHGDTRTRARANIALLRAELDRNPNNARAAFYLAQSYCRLRDAHKALEYYRKRIAMGGSDEEVFWSRLQVARLLEVLHIPIATVVAAYRAAHLLRPYRVEPISCLAHLYNIRGEHQLAYTTITAWQRLPKTNRKDALFTLDWIEEYGLLCELALASFQTGQRDAAIALCDKLLAMPTLPPVWRTAIERINALARPSDL